MESRKIVWQQTRVVILGQLICCSIMVGIFAILGYFDRSVVFGALMGAFLSVANFFIMALCADMAADKGAQQDVKGGQALIQMSYIGRMVGLLLILVLCAKSGFFHLLALVIPLVFTRPILTAAEFMKKKGGTTP